MATHHRGAVVEEAVRKSGFPLKKLAERLGISRNTLYNKFRDPLVSYSFIQRIGQIIFYNFGFEFPEMDTTASEAAEPDVTYSRQDTRDLISVSKRYVGVLEQQNKLLSVLVRVANDNISPAVKSSIDQFINSEPFASD